MNSWMAWRCWLGVAELSSDVTTTSPDTAARRWSACHSMDVRWGGQMGGGGGRVRRLRRAVQAMEEMTSFQGDAC
ncbi:hypothetical protein PF005_g9807 [Phytophthora fragariae]|uniref:Uncharacterized protein n=1 Tax=Phytophthora fragariae TaxID=53985 RepID=A0A6A4DWU0_9STRA|nr:hypothetical protein PF003_g16654 [Phytophthora fragariae]KAE8935904.1 hypothetical protein PF009_g14149 [Phytophthora fragariae]KAE8990667.1 hypothetical protein PF011_g18261 [Phytophthora fragariae]KAE9089763.1 hypothetical protein PF010_g18861 [Phytophthora fragariae]KAE9119666.1 hypothetical protein PF006_g18305 [Phytophthora fragariae]